jgi:transcription elongation factor Elf1
MKEDKIICMQCNKEVKGISPFMKTNMRNSNDTVSPEEKIKIPEGGMIVECKHCDAKVSAEVDRKLVVALCTECGRDMELSEFAIQLLKENGVYSKKFKERIINPSDDDLDLGGNQIVRKATKPTVKVNIIKPDTDATAPKRGRGRPKKVAAEVK